VVVAGVVASLAFVALPIIAGEAGHELMILDATVVVDELAALWQRRGVSVDQR